MIARAIARPLHAVFILGCTVSFIASGRLTPRLLLDGCVSFAFLPAFSALGFGFVFLAGGRRVLRFGDALDAFFAGQWPWLVWLSALALVCVTVPPHRLGPWLMPLVIALSLPAIASAALDYRFFRTAMARTRRAAIRDLVLTRGLSWGLSVAYFFGSAIRGEVAPQLLEWVGR
jgi:hypothetical protein